MSKTDEKRLAALALAQQGRSTKAPGRSPAKASRSAGKRAGASSGGKRGAAKGRPKANKNKGEREHNPYLGPYDQALATYKTRRPNPVDAPEAPSEVLLIATSGSPESEDTAATASSVSPGSSFASVGGGRAVSDDPRVRIDDFSAKASTGGYDLSQGSNRAGSPAMVIAPLGGVSSFEGAKIDRDLNRSPSIPDQVGVSRVATKAVAAADRKAEAAHRKADALARAEAQRQIDLANLEVERTRALSKAEQFGDSSEYLRIEEKFDKERNKLLQQKRVDGVRQLFNDAERLFDEAKRFDALRDATSKEVDRLQKLIDEDRGGASTEAAVEQLISQVDEYRTKAAELRASSIQSNREAKKEAKKLFDEFGIQVSESARGARPESKASTAVVAASAAAPGKRGRPAKYSEKQNAEFEKSKKEYPGKHVTRALNSDGTQSIKVQEKTTMAAKSQAKKAASKPAAKAAPKAAPKKTPGKPGRKPESKAVKAKKAALKLQYPGDTISVRKEDGKTVFFRNGIALGASAAAPQTAKKTPGKKAAPQTAKKAPGKKAAPQTAKKAPGKKGSKPGQVKPENTIYTAQGLEKLLGRKPTEKQLAAIMAAKPILQGAGKKNSGLMLRLSNGRVAASKGKNPIITPAMVGVGAGGAALGLVSANVIDRLVSSMDGGEHYGADAVIRQLKAPGALRLGVNAGAGLLVAMIGLAVVENHGKTGAGLVGFGGAHLAFAFEQLVVRRLLPYFFRAESGSEMNLGNRLYPVEQQEVQDELDRAIAEIDQFPVPTIKGTDGQMMLANESNAKTGGALNINSRTDGTYPLSSKPAAKPAVSAGSDASAMSTKSSAAPATGTPTKAAADAAAKARSAQILRSRRVHAGRSNLSSGGMALNLGSRPAAGGTSRAQAHFTQAYHQAPAGSVAGHVGDCGNGPCKGGAGHECQGCKDRMITEFDVPPGTPIGVYYTDGVTMSGLGEIDKSFKVVPGTQVGYYRNDGNSLRHDPHCTGSEYTYGARSQQGCSMAPADPPGSRQACEHGSAPPQDNAPPALPPAMTPPQGNAPPALPPSSSIPGLLTPPPARNPRLVIDQNAPPVPPVQQGGTPAFPGGQGGRAMQPSSTMPTGSAMQPSGGQTALVDGRPVLVTGNDVPMRPPVEQPKIMDMAPIVPVTHILPTFAPAAPVIGSVEAPVSMGGPGKSSGKKKSSNTSWVHLASRSRRAS